MHKQGGVHPCTQNKHTTQNPGKHACTDKPSKQKSMYRNMRAKETQHVETHARNMHACTHACMHASARAVEDEDEDVDEEVAECTHARTDPTERQKATARHPKNKHSMYKHMHATCMHAPMHACKRKQKSGNACTKTCVQRHMHDEQLQDEEQQEVDDEEVVDAYTKNACHKA